MIISGASFWQQDRYFWARSARESQSLASSASLMSVMSDAITSESQGLASIANQTALNRTNSALSAAVQSALNGSTATSAGGSSSSSASSAPSSAAGSTSASAGPNDSGAISGPATGVGTVPLTNSTPLLTFHIIKGGTFSVSDGIGATVYTSNGSDTVGDVIKAINDASPGHAQAFAWLDSNGKLNIAATDTTHTITIGGSAAAALGFGAGHTSFQPVTNTASSSTTAATGASATGANGASSTTTKPTSASPKLFAQNSAPSLLSGGTAEILLASNGSAGFLVNLLA